MSAQHAPVFVEAALVITPVLADAINAAIPNNPYTGEGEGDNVGAAFDALEARGVQNAYFLYSFSGSRFPINADGTLAEAKVEKDAIFGYIAADRASNLFRATYNGLEELVEEFRAKLAAADINVGDFPLETCIFRIAGNDAY